MSLKAELALKSALLSTGLVQPVDSRVRKNRVEVLCRQVPGQEKPWLEVVDIILRQFDASSQNVHLCRRYIHKDGRMVFGWHVQVEAEKAKELQEAVYVVTQVLASAKPELTPVEAAAPKEPPRPPQVPRQQAPQRQRPLAPGQHPPPKPAAPRQPEGGPGTVHDAPEGFEPRVRVIERTRTADGKEMIVEEMPLPHIHRDLNVLTKPRLDEKTGRMVGGGRGAAFTGAGR